MECFSVRSEDYGGEGEDARKKCGQVGISDLLSQKMKRKPTQIRLSRENLKWIRDYKRMIMAPASINLISNMLMEKGREKMPGMRSKEIQ